MKKNSAKLWAGVLLPLLLAGLVLWIYYGSGQDEVKRGREVYMKHCGNCHGPAGEGLRRLVPPLTSLDHLSTSELICIIRYGQSGPIQIQGVEYNQPMPASRELENDEIADLVNYLYTEIGHKDARTSLPEVNRSLESCR